MNATTLALLDALLMFLASARVTRFFVTDTLGRRIVDKLPRNTAGAFLRELTDCIYCTSFWVAAAAVATWWFIPSPVWQLLAAPFALSWLVAHVGLRLGDAGYDEEEHDEN